jgi:tetratricopeptide (TPR) repeat protein
MRIIHLTWFLIAGSIISNDLLAASPQVHADSISYEQKLEDGIEAFYRADWIEAKAVFKELRRERPDDSRAYFFESMIPFWKYYFGGRSKQAAKQFLSQSQHAIEVSQNQLSKNSGDTTMVLMLSGLYGYRSLVAAAEKNYKEALQSGMTGFKYTRQLLALDANDPKALIGKGMFYYMVGSVPDGLKWATNMIGMSADMQKGFDVLEQAAKSNSYVRNDAQMILAYLYEREQKDEKALKHLEALSARYPKNIIFQYNRARLLEKTNQIDQARAKYRMIASMDTNALDILKQKSKDRLQKL